jgi:hypothetical protein
VFQQDPLELVLSPGLQQTLPEIHVGQQGGKRSASFQCVLRPFLVTKKNQTKNKMGIK